MENYSLLNGVTLAYVGDSYYELCIRKYLIDKNYTKVQDLHRFAVRFVSAEAQAKIIQHLISENYLNEVEVEYVKRGRNAKANHKRPNVDMITYKHSTSFESLVGYLYLTNQTERLNQIIEKAIKIIENGDNNG